VAYVKVAAVEDVSPGQMKRVEIEDEPIALYHTGDGQWFATSDVCTHAGESLTSGTLESCVVACPQHGGKFDVRSGAAVAMPCVVAVETYPVEIRGGDVFLDFE